MENIVYGWLVLEMTNSVWHVALIGFFRTAPLLIVGFFSGLVADRLGRRKVIIGAQVVNLCVPALILLLLVLKRLLFWHIALAAVILGIFWTLGWPARRSLVPDLIGKKQVVDGLLLEGVFQNVARIIGPLMGGGLIRLLGMHGSLGVLAAVSGAGFLILLGLSHGVAPSGRVSDSQPWKAVLDGLSYIRRDQTILGVMLITIAMNFLVFPFLSLLPVFSRDVLGQGPFGLGLLGAGHGIGTFTGLLLVNRYKRRWRLTRIFAIGSFIQAAVLVAFSFSRSFPLSVLLLFLSGLGQTSFGIMQSSIILISSSDEMRGRTMGVLNTAIGASSLGSLQIGALASAFGAPIALGLTCGVSALLILVVTAVLPGFRGEGLMAGRA
jgi:MFS family permease